MSHNLGLSDLIQAKYLGGRVHHKSDAAVACHGVGSHAASICPVSDDAKPSHLVKVFIVHLDSWSHLTKHRAALVNSDYKAPEGKNEASSPSENNALCL